MKTTTLDNMAKQRTDYKRYTPLMRIRIGKILSVIAALPLFTSWLFIFSIPMMMTLSPSMWAKDKIRYLNEMRMLRL